MPRHTWIIFLAYPGILICNVLVREHIPRHDIYILFWALIAEHLVMIPLTIAAFSKKSANRFLKGSLGALTSAACLFLIFLITVDGASDPGMGLIIFLLFPAVQAVLASAGLLGLLVALLRSKRRATGQP